MSSQQEEIPLEEIVYTASKETNSSILKPQTKTKKCNYFLYLIAAIANLLSFATGSSVTWVTPVIPKLSTLSHDNPFGRPITLGEISWIAGLLPLGAIVGPMVAGKVADKLGRKPVLLILACIYIVSLLVVSFSNLISLFYLSRFLAGVALGSTFAVLPMYLIEIAETHNRGTLGCSVNIFVAIGFNFSLLVGPYLSIQTFSLICLCPLIIFIPSFFLLSPESPSFLASVDKEETLKATLIKLRNTPSDQIQLEIRSIVESTQQNRESKGGIQDLIKIRSMRKGLIICLGLISIQQLTGVGAIFSYMPKIFQSAKVNLAPEICSIIVGSTQILGTMTSAVTVDKAGRKILLLASTIGSCTTLLVLGLYFYRMSNGYQVMSLSWLPVASLVVLILAFSVGLGPVPWVVVSELFPSNLRSTAASLTSLVCFVVTFMVTVTFPLLFSYLGEAKYFLIFSVICIAGSLFIYWVVPETKGKNLQEIQKMLGRIKS